MWHQLIETLIQMAHVYGWKGVTVWDQNFLLATKWKSLIMQILEETGLFYMLWDHSCCLIITKIKLTLSQRKIRNTEGPWSKHSVWFHEENCFYSNSSKHTRGIIYCFFCSEKTKTARHSEIYQQKFSWFSFPALLCSWSGILYF